MQTNLVLSARTLSSLQKKWGVPHRPYVAVLLGQRTTEKNTLDFPNNGVQGLGGEGSWEIASLRKQQAEVEKERDIIKKELSIISEVIVDL